MDSAQLNRRWNQILKKDPVWCRLFYSHFPHVNPSAIKNFQNAYYIHFNVTNGVYASHTLEQRGRWITSLAIADGKLFFSYGHLIKVWDLKREGCTAIFLGHSNQVFSLAIADGKFFSSSSDSTIKVWDIKTGECTAIFQGHKNNVRCLAVADGKLFAGSWDNKMGFFGTTQFRSGI